MNKENIQTMFNPLAPRWHVCNSQRLGFKMKKRNKIWKELIFSSNQKQKDSQRISVEFLRVTLLLLLLFVFGPQKKHKLEPRSSFWSRL